jgi:molecular chaperone DnaK (HSP70)
MSDTGAKAGPEPSERTAIGITFGNSNSSIAYLVDDKAEVIANEDGGVTTFLCSSLPAIPRSNSSGD